MSGRNGDRVLPVAVAAKKPIHPAMTNRQGIACVTVIVSPPQADHRPRHWKQRCRKQFCCLHAIDTYSLNRLYCKPEAQTVDAQQKTGARYRAPACRSIKQNIGFNSTAELTYGSLQAPLLGGLVKKSTSLLYLDPVIHVVDPNLIILRQQHRNRCRSTCCLYRDGHYLLEFFS